MGVFATHIWELAHMVGAVAAEGISDSGTTTTLVDADRLEADDAWNKQILYVYAGTALGNSAEITDFANSTNQFTLSPAITSPGADSKYIVLHKGWTVEMLRRAIVLAIRMRRRDMLLPKVDDTVTLDASTPTYEYTIPTGFVSIYQILRETTAASGIFLEEIGQEAWYISKTATRKIVFDKTLVGKDGILADNTDIRIIGQQYETEPTTDSATISIPMGTLLLLAASLAHTFVAPHDLNNSEKRMQLSDSMLQRFEQYKWSDYQPIYPGSVKVEDM